MRSPRHLWSLLLVTFLSCTAIGQSPKRMTIKEAEETAIRNHPQIGAALLTSLAASQVPDEINALRYPTAWASVSGTGAPDNTRIAAGGLNNPSIFPRMAAGITVNQLVSDFGRTGSLAESSRLHARAVEENVASTKALIVLQVDQAYYRALRAQAVLKVAQQTVASRQLVADQAEALQKSGLKSGLDVSIANYGLAEAQLMYARLQNDIKAAFAELSEALGSGDEQSFELAEEAIAPSTLASETDSISAALGKRPEIRALKFERDGAYQFLQAERSLRKPTITAVLSTGVIPFHDNRLANTYTAAGINVNIPVFSGKLFKARATEADYRAKAIDQHLTELNNRVSREVRLAWLNADTSFRNIGLAAQLVTRAREAFDLAQERYRLGLSSIIELSQAQLNLTIAEMENANARYEYLIRRAVLDYQSGISR